MKDNLKAYIEEVDEETQFMMDDYPQRDTAFTAYILGEISELINMSDFRIEHCINKNSAHNILGEIYGYSISDSKEVLTLIYTLYNPTAAQEIKSLRDSEYQTALNRLQGFYKAATRGLHLDLLEAGDETSPCFEIAKDIYDNMSKIITVRLLVISNSTINKCEIKNQRISGKATYADVWDLKKIYANLHSGSDHAAIDVDFLGEYKHFKIPFIEMESNDFGYKCIIALFPGKLLYQLYEKHNTDLLLNNVRFFLGFRGARRNNANIGILDTLKKESQMFLAYNNGITALASNIESEPIGDKTNVSEGNIGNDFISMGVLKAIRDFRIVNGGQTTAAIFNAKYKDHNISLHGVYIQVKIIILNKDIHKISGLITKYSNSQSHIKYSDFTVSNNFNMTMESLSRNTKIPNKNNEPIYWYFERLRGQYDEEKNQNRTKESKNYFMMKYPKDKRFKKEELAKVWKSWKQEPYNAVKGEGTNYDLFITENVDYTPDEEYYRKSIALLIIYRFILLRPECKQYGNGKATVATYTLAYLNYITFNKLDLEKIWREQKLSDNLKAFLIQLSENIHTTAVDIAGKTTVLTWGKRKDAFKELTSQKINYNRELLKGECL